MVRLGLMATILTVCYHNATVNNQHLVLAQLQAAPATETHLDDKARLPYLPVDDEPEGRSNRTRFIILIVVVGLALAYMIYAAFPKNALAILVPSELDANLNEHQGTVVRLSGKLVDGSFRREEKSIVARFQLTDKDGESPHTSVDAMYASVLPDLFFNPHSEIILEGSVGTDGVFQADHVLVKCPSKYRSLEEEQQQPANY